MYMVYNVHWYNVCTWYTMYIGTMYVHGIQCTLVQCMYMVYNVHGTMYMYVTVEVQGMG